MSNLEKNKETVFLIQALRLFKSEQPWCRSQAQINGEGCDRKGIRPKNTAKYFSMRIVKSDFIPD